MAPLLFALAFVTAARSAEAQRLGRILAEKGTLASLLPLMKAKETEELVKEDPSLSAAEQAELRETAERVYKAQYARVMKATGDAYAQQLSVNDLRDVIAFYQTPAAAKYRAVTPNVILATMQSLGQVDFKGDVRKAFCAQTKRLCSAK